MYQITSKGGKWSQRETWDRKNKTGKSLMSKIHAVKSCWLRVRKSALRFIAAKSKEGNTIK